MKLIRIHCTRVSSPLLFQSKILFLSLLYLFTTLPLSIYITFSQSGCLFHPPPISENSHLFAYPKSYGEHKYALPTTRSSCSSPVQFPEHKVAFEEIGDLCRNFSSQYASPVLSYLQGGEESFAGNFSTQKRISYFDIGGGDSEKEIPCGFLRELPVSESDRLAMEACNGVVVASVVFGDHDKIRQPKGLGAKTLETVCFFMFIDEHTLKSLNTHKILSKDEDKVIGAWRIVRFQSDRLPYDNPAMNGVIFKYLIHRLFPNSKFSIWLDAKIQLTVDPLLLLHSLVISKDVDMALSKHPFNVHTMEEAMATARWKKWWDLEGLRLQMETYCENGLEPWSPSKLPYTTDVPDTAVIARRHVPASNHFSCLLFNELEAFNPRDQLAFSYVRDLMNPKIKIYNFEVEVFEQIAIEYRHNLKREADRSSSSAKKKIRRASLRDIRGSSCEGYFRKMWGDYSNL